MPKKGSPTRRYWLMKSEPAEFSIADLERVNVERWDGVRNYQVRNMMRDEMRRGDTALFYHSNAAEIGVVGEMEIVSEAYPDPTQFMKKHKHFDPQSKPDDPRWLCVDVGYRATFPKTVTRDELKQVAALQHMQTLQKGCRLSITPVTKVEYNTIIKLAHQTKTG